MASTEDVVQVDQTEAAVHEVVTAVAEQTGIGVLDLPPLEGSVDTDALAALLQNEATSKVEFPYAGHTVAVAGDGHVRVADGA